MRYFKIIILILITSCGFEENDDVNIILFSEYPVVSIPQFNETIIEGNDIIIRWDKVENAEFYVLYQSYYEDFDFEQMRDNIYDDHIEIYNLSVGEEYYFYLIAVGKFGQQSKESIIINIIIQ